MLKANNFDYAATRIRAPKGRLDHPKLGVNLGTLVGNSVVIPLVPSKPHFLKFSYLGFMCLVHEPENTHF